MTVNLSHKQPCNDCPWRREHPVGWLGGYPAEWFTERLYADVPLNCHKTIGDVEGMPETLIQDTRPLCAGALITYKNMLKLPRRPDLAEAVIAVEKSEHVFRHPQEFLDRHDLD